MKLGFHPWISQPHPDLWHLCITVEENVEDTVEESDNRDPKGDKVPLGKIVFKEMIQFSFVKFLDK